MRDQNSSINDPHYYPARNLTFELPVIMSLRQLGRHDEAELIVVAQQEQSCKDNNHFHTIQANTQLCEIKREKFEKGEGTIDAALAHALDAIQIIKTLDAQEKESFVKHPIHFNARVAAMKAYNIGGYEEKAQNFAQAILDEFEQDSNCGAKEWHLEEAQKIVTPLSTYSPI